MVFIPFFYRLSTIQGGAGYGFYPIFYRLYDASHDFDAGYNPMIYSVFLSIESDQLPKVTFYSRMVHLKRA